MVCLPTKYEKLKIIGNNGSLGVIKWKFLSMER